MKFRVMASDGTDKFFDEDEEPKARALFEEKKKKTGRLVLTGRIKTCNIHRCFHDENPTKPCVIIERVTK